MTKYLVKKDFNFKEVDHKEGEIIELEETDASPMVADGTLEVMVA